MIETLGLEGYGFWWAIAETLYQVGGKRILISDLWIESLAKTLNSHTAFVRKSLETIASIGLIDDAEFQKGYIFSQKILEDVVATFRTSKYLKHQATIFQRDGFQCKYCGNSNDLTLDHIFPRSRGGSDDLDNLTTACRSCNSRKGARTPEEWMGGKS